MPRRPCTVRIGVHFVTSRIISARAHASTLLSDLVRQEPSRVPFPPSQG
ncbi:uncharacterized, partial [Tachysurus ichikawai]